MAPLDLKIVVNNYGDGFSYDRADLINPVLIDADGNETSLTSLQQASYTSEWGTLHVNKNVEGGTLKVDGQTYTTGLGMNAQCTLVYNLPSGHNYKTFRALCGYDSSCDTDNKSTSGTTMEFLFYVVANNSFDFDLSLIGYPTFAQKPVPVYDIWAKENVGWATGTLSVSIPSHGVKLFRLGDNINSVTPPTVAPNGETLESQTKKSSDAYYDLRGVRITQPGKGIYIHKGKKRVKK